MTFHMILIFFFTMILYYSIYNSKDLKSKTFLPCSSSYYKRPWEHKFLAPHRIQPKMSSHQINYVYPTSFLRWAINGLPCFKRIPDEIVQEGRKKKKKQKR